MRVKLIAFVLIGTGTVAYSFKSAQDKHPAQPTPLTVPSKADKAMIRTPPMLKNTSMGASRVKTADVVFVHCSEAKGRKFVGDYFGLPVIIGPYSNGRKMQLIKDKKLYTFGEEGLGFRFIDSIKLPVPPPDDEARAGMPKHQFELLTALTRATGYQCGENGDIYWVGSKNLSRYDGNSWKTRYVYPEIKKESNITMNLLERGGLVVLPKNRVAIFGGLDAFIKIVELGDDAKTSGKEIKIIGYDQIGCSFDSYPIYARPAFCVFENYLYFYLHKTGHFFRMDLDSFNLIDYDVPWAYEEFSEKPNTSFWTNLGDSDGTFPQVPASILYLPGPTGTLLAYALMFNISTPCLRVFELSSESSKIQTKTFINEVFPTCLQYNNPKGEPECIPE